MGALVPKEERAKREVENGYLQFDELRRLIRKSVDEPRFDLKPSVIMALNRLAIDGLVSNPGMYRQTGMSIDGSKHQPPDAAAVPEAIDDLCTYVNANWARTSIHLAAYVMWRLNWIHPFPNGNGRTSRAVSYLVLCAHIRAELPGDNTIPKQIAEQKDPYYRALEEADRALANGGVDLSEMESLLGEALKRQIYDAATASWPSRESRPAASLPALRMPTGVQETPETRAIVKAAWITGALAVGGAAIAALAQVCGAG